MIKIWDGIGDPSEDEIIFFRSSGVPVGKPFIIDQSKEYLDTRFTGFSEEQRDFVLNETVRNDEWLNVRNGRLVASIVSGVVGKLISGKFGKLSE
jgi:hypothetical protein